MTSLVPIRPEIQGSPFFQLSVSWRRLYPCNFVLTLLGQLHIIKSTKQIKVKNYSAHNGFYLPKHPFGLEFKEGLISVRAGGKWRAESENKSRSRPRENHVLWRPFYETWLIMVSKDFQNVSACKNLHYTNGACALKEMHCGAVLSDCGHGSVLSDWMSSQETFAVVLYKNNRFLGWLQFLFECFCTWLILFLFLATVFVSEPEQHQIKSMQKDEEEAGKGDTSGKQRDNVANQKKLFYKKTIF